MSTEVYNQVRRLSLFNYDAIYIYEIASRIFNYQSALKRILADIDEQEETKFNETIELFENEYKNLVAALNNAIPQLKISVDDVLNDINITGQSITSDKLKAYWQSQKS